MNPYLHPDRLFPIEPKTREMARELYSLVKNEPIISPHGHTDQRWFAYNEAFSDPVSLLITPDHYLLRMFYSQGMKLEDFGVKQTESDKRKIWKLLAQNFHLFRGTPSSLWLKHVFHEVFGIEKPLNVENADFYFDHMSEKLKSKEFLPRTLFEKFNISVLATTDAATDDLKDHLKIKNEWGKRVIPTYRPDAVVDPEHEEFQKNLKLLSDLTNEDCYSWRGYLSAHKKRRKFFKEMGATATDHGHPSARTLNLSDTESEKLFAKVSKGSFTPGEAESFRALMLYKMAEMSLEDKLVMQLHPGSYRNHNPELFAKFGRDKGADIPKQMEYVEALKPLLDSFGNKSDLRLILFTLDESTYSRELAPLAGHYPALMLGPAWWFHDSPEGILRHRKATMETAGFYNVTGFIDDTRAFFSIPARHDVSRRMDARILSELVMEHRMTMDEAKSLIHDITVKVAKESYRL